MRQLLTNKRSAAGVDADIGANVNDCFFLLLPGAIAVGKSAQFVRGKIDSGAQPLSAAISLGERPAESILPRGFAACHQGIQRASLFAMTGLNSAVWPASVLSAAFTTNWPTTSLT